MRLLHISDIHFRSPECLNPSTDPDLPFRSRLEIDLRELCHKDDIPVDVILVGGDIAYRGHPDEYKAAKEWLLRMAGLCGCKPAGILTVPGNHDVDRNICASVPVSNAQEAIANEVDLAGRDKQIARQLGNRLTGSALFEPLGAYNEFAAQFGCSIFPTHPFWEKDLELAQGVTLRVFGLTSVLISGLGGRDDTPGQLFLGSAQTVLNPQDDVMNLVLCHHPPSWFSDASSADNTFGARAPLQFFGHEHDQRCFRPPEYFRFMAGAVNPARDELRWSPGYNLVDLNVDGDGAARGVQVRARLRRFQPAPNELFIPIFTQERDDIWRHRLRLPQWPSFAIGSSASMVNVPPQSETKIASAVHNALDVAAVETQCKSPMEVEVPTPSTDNLIFRFWQLSSSQMRDIALELGLITRDDLQQVPPHERYHKALLVAKQNGLLAELAKRIEQYEKNA